MTPAMQATSIKLATLSFFKIETGSVVGIVMVYRRTALVGASRDSANRMHQSTSYTSINPDKRPRHVPAVQDLHYWTASATRKSSLVNLLQLEHAGCNHQVPKDSGFVG